MFELRRTFNAHSYAHIPQTDSHIHQMKCIEFKYTIEYICTHIHTSLDIENRNDVDITYHAPC